jgi:5,10-methylenetetrahydromethanopterin reductase
MSTTPPRRLGAMFDRDRAPEELAGFARDLDASGLDDLWLVEDLGWAGGISSAAVALTASPRLRVGIGIVPAPLRNPALLAMELATLARLYPDRLVAGIGHGVAGWMAQVGAATPHKLALLEETVLAVRGLLRGETVTVDGRTVHMRQTALVHPPQRPPLVVTGVVGPRSLELSGRVADGTIIAEGHGPDDLAAARGHIAADGPHELIVYVYLCVDDDPERLRATTAPVLAGQAGWLGVDPSTLYLAGGPAAVAAQRVRALWDAGAHTVVLRPIGADPLGQLHAVTAALGDRP